MQPPVTTTEFLRALSTYFVEQIAPGTQDRPVDFERLLSANVEVLIVLDGVDEVAPQVIPNVLEQLGDLVNRWPNVRVMATGRPVELIRSETTHGRFSRQLLSLPNSESSSSLKSFGRRQGARRRGTIGAAASHEITSAPALEQLASTPLASRLLYGRLTAPTSTEHLTVGDLLYDLVRERLSSWATHDHRETLTPRFDAKFPDDTSRAVLLGHLALRAETRKRMRVEEARLIFHELIQEVTGSREPVLADEALKYYELAGLLAVDGYVEFTIESIRQLVAGWALADDWGNGRETRDWMVPDQWRTLSFCATALRRTGKLEAQRSRLIHLQERLLRSPWLVPAVAYVVGEARDRACAVAFIKQLEHMGAQPLSLFHEERYLSARAIAEAIQLAGTAGFVWFFRQYLDPRDPTINAGCAVPDSIFGEWARLAVDEIGAEEREILGRLVRPYLAAGDTHMLSVLPRLALLVPEAFTMEQRLRAAGRLLGTGALAGRVAKVFIDVARSDLPLVNSALLEHTAIGYENGAHAASLWLKLNPCVVPPRSVLRVLLVARRTLASPYREEYGAAYQDCVNRVGASAWMRLMRWYISDDDAGLSACAAVELHTLGERRLSTLGRALLFGLNDGGRDPVGAEQVLRQLLLDGGERAVTRLAELITVQRGVLGGAPSPWWRLLFSVLPQIDDRAPELLAGCMAGLSSVTLPESVFDRNSTISYLGPDGLRYREALRARLKDLNPGARRGAAMVLLTVNPKNKLEALRVVLHARDGRFSDWEWPQFCLSLALGPNLLTCLKDGLADFDENVRVLALALLHRNDSRSSPARAAC